MDKKQWLQELRQAEKNPRFLTKEDPAPSSVHDMEQCVICDDPTVLWLMPENAALCGDLCLEAYLRDPSIYDPRKLHTGPKPRARRSKTKRWEPSEKYIEEAQKRVAKWVADGHYDPDDY